MSFGDELDNNNEKTWITVYKINETQKLVTYPFNFVNGTCECLQARFRNYFGILKE